MKSMIECLLLRSTEQSNNLATKKYILQDKKMQQILSFYYIAIEMNSLMGIRKKVKTNVKHISNKL